MSDDENGLFDTEVGCPRATLRAQPGGQDETVQRGCPRATLRAQLSGQYDHDVRPGCSRATLRAQLSGRYDHSIQPGCSRATLRAQLSGRYDHIVQPGCSRATLRPAMGGYTDDMVIVQGNKDQLNAKIIWEVWCEVLIQVLVCLMSLWLLPDSTQREANVQTMTVTRVWADCGATQDGGIWVAQPLDNESASLSEDSSSCERGGSDLEQERENGGGYSRIHSNSSSSELD